MLTVYGDIILMTRNHEYFVKFVHIYWRYYRELENEFLATRQYVDFKEGNFNTYSVEFLKLYQAVCSEIDVIGKAMAAEYNSTFKPNDKRNNICKWWFEIQHKAKYNDKYEDINGTGTMLAATCVCLTDELDLTPWNSFETEQYKDKKGALRYRTSNSMDIPKWWSAYNKVKHGRAYASSMTSSELNYTKANLGNVCNAIAGLYILEKSYLEAIGTKTDLQAFSDYSVLFDRITNATNKDIEVLFQR